MSTDELVHAVIMWGREKKIDNPVSQMNKITEEVGEIAHEITRGQYNTREDLASGEKPLVYDDQIKDAIGDSLVTIILLADIVGTNPIDCLALAYEEIKGRQGETIGGNFVKNEAE